MTRITQTLPSQPRLFGLFHAIALLFSIVVQKQSDFKSALMLLVILLTKKSPHIILADDDSEDQELFLSAVEEIEPNVKVTLANNGQELMNLLNKNMATPPDVIFLDINMPFKNGQECLTEIRNDSKLKSIPIIIFTTSSSRVHIDETYKGGANYYISKPDSFKDLKTVTQKMLAVDWDKHSQPIKEKFVVSAKA